jgi:hypothetical protein
MQSQIQVGAPGQRRTARNSRGLAVRAILIIFLVIISLNIQNVSIPPAVATQRSFNVVQVDDSGINPKIFQGTSHVE